MICMYLYAIVSLCVCQEPELREREDEAEDAGHAGPGGLSGVLHRAGGPSRRQGDSL